MRVLPVPAEHHRDGQRDGRGDREQGPRHRARRAGVPVGHGPPGGGREHPEPVADRGAQPADEPLHQPAARQQRRGERQAGEEQGEPEPGQGVGQVAAHPRRRGLRRCDRAPGPDAIRAGAVGPGAIGPGAIGSRPRGGRRRGRRARGGPGRHTGHRRRLPGWEEGHLHLTRCHEGGLPCTAGTTSKRVGWRDRQRRTGDRFSDMPASPRERTASFSATARRAVAGRRRPARPARPAYRRRRTRAAAAPAAPARAAGRARRGAGQRVGHGAGRRRSRRLHPGAVGQLQPRHVLHDADQPLAGLQRDRRPPAPRPRPRPAAGW